MPLQFRDEKPESSEPKGRKGTSKIVDFALLNELKANAGKWAVIASAGDRKKADSLANAYKRFGCETAERKNTNGLIDVWASWPVAATEESSTTS